MAKQIECNLNLKHARDAAINALSVLNDLEFYASHMPRARLQKRFEDAREYLRGAEAELQAFEASMKTEEHAP